MPDFYPPQVSPALVKFFQWISPLVGRWIYRMDLEIDPAYLNQLRSLRRERVILLANHPTFHDWIAIFLLSAKLGRSFHYMAAYERFKGLGGKLLQALGAYSVRRGLGDRPSIAKTIELLTQPTTHLVIFPEGGCSFQNDTVMPFRTGAVQVGFQAMNRLVKRGEPVPDFYAVPISIKYRNTGSMSRVIHKTLYDLEQALHIPSGGDRSAVNFYQRLRTVGEHVTMRVEKDYGLYTPETAAKSLNERIPALRNHILTSCEQRLGITPSPKLATRERVYKIQYVLESQAQQLADDDFWTYDSIHKAAARLLNFDAIYDGYVADAPTPERFLDTLVRLEREVFNIGEPVPKIHRQVILCVGAPMNLKDYFEQYQQQKSQTIDRLAEQLRQIVQKNLDRLNQVN